VAAQRFIIKKFRSETQRLINTANGIIEEYSAQSLTLTLRQLYYQFVARDMIPNTQKSYNRLGSIINDGRLAGEIDWNAIEDRGRNVHNLHIGYHGLDSALNNLVRGYARKLWERQPYHVEVWVAATTASTVPLTTWSGVTPGSCGRGSRTT